MRSTRLVSLLLMAGVLLLSGDWPGRAEAASSYTAFRAAPPLRAAADPGARRVNAPYLEEGLDWNRAAIFWFGQNEQGDPPTRNYVDVRVGYTADGLHIQATIADYYLWYDESATASSDLTQYDALAVYLDAAHDRAAAPQSDDYRFLVGALHWQDIDDYVRQARGSGSGWNTAWRPSAAWSADAWMSWDYDSGPNSNEGGIDYGWTAILDIPWQTLGLAAAPGRGTTWGLGVHLYDRDSAAPGGYVDPESWPEGLASGAPASWGELAFDPPAYQPPPATATGTTIIRRAAEADTSVVQDAWVGGGGSCSGAHEGGADTNHGGFNPDGTVRESELYLGSETAVTHLPCFNKSFLRFSLDEIPRNKVILSAQLTLHHWGNSGDPSAARDEDRPHDSYAWLYAMTGAWAESGVTWNNAPLAGENIDVVRITPLSAHPGWPGVAYTWDATEAVAAAYAAGQVASLAIYDSAAGRNTSKYLTSSETGDWNAEGRPTLTVVWGEPRAALRKEAQPVSVTRNDVVSYTLSWLGTGGPLTVTDTLPSGLGHPTAITASSGGWTYDGAARRVVWTGTPLAGQAVTLTMSVHVEVDGPLVLRNTAVLAAEGGSSSTADATIIVDPSVVYLPLVSR